MITFQVTLRLSSFNCARMVKVLDHGFFVLCNYCLYFNAFYRVMKSSQPLLVYCELKNFQLDMVWVYFQLNKCTCTRSDNHGCIFFNGSSTPTIVIIDDMRIAVKRKIKISIECVAVAEAGTQFRFKHEDNLGQFSKIYLPLYVSAFDTAYIQRQTNVPFPSVRLWVSPKSTFQPPPTHTRLVV